MSFIKCSRQWKRSTVHRLLKPNPQLLESKVSKARNSCTFPTEIRVAQTFRFRLWQEDIGLARH
jgi:hypothetical protein